MPALSSLPSWDLIALPVVLAFATAAAWGDLRPMLPFIFSRSRYRAAVHGRIPNRLLLAWLVVGAALLGGGLAVLAAGGRFDSPGLIAATEELPYWAAVGLNSGIAFGLGFVLWLLNLWAAGDAKVFALLAFTLPLGTYRENYLPWFPSFALFFNTFVAVFLLLLFEFLVDTAWAVVESRGRFLSDKAVSLWRKASQNWLLVLRVLLLFLALFTAVRVARHFVREGLDQFMQMNQTIIYVVLFIMFKPIMRLAEKKWMFAASAAVVGGYAVYAFAFDPTGQARYEFINLGWLAVSVIVFRLVYDAYLKATDEVRIPNADLRPGMILADAEVTRFKERKEFFRERIGDLTADGLSGEQVDALKEWFARNAPEDEVAVSRTIPFAPALLLGAVLTVLSRGLVVVL